LPGQPISHSRHAATLRRRWQRLLDSRFNGSGSKFTYCASKAA